MSKTLTISPGEHFRIYCGDHDRYELIEKETKNSHSWRHGYGGIMIFKDNETGTLYETSWRNSSNDMNSWNDMNFGDQHCHEVEPKEKTITIYERVN